MSNKDIDSIYNALDRGDYAKAQQICERPEVSKFALTQALLAYTYASQRKIEKALDLGRKLLNSEPSDESTVNALGCAFKLCHSDVDFAACYETAIKKNPAVPPHFHSELFYCYLRMNDVKKMQLVAQRAYKMTDNPRYVAWMATCILLQPDLPPQMLAVADKMISKVFHEIRPDNAPGFEELMLFLTIVIREKKLPSSTELILQLLQRSNASNTIVQDEEHFRENPQFISSSKQQKLFLQLDLHCVSSNFDQAVQTAYAILEELPDQWNVYKLLHQLSFSRPPFVLMRGNVVGKSLKFESFSGLASLNETDWNLDLASSQSLSPETYHRHLLSIMRKHPKIRGPWLAHLYFLQNLLLVCSKEKDTASTFDTSEIVQTALTKEFNEEICQFITNRNSLMSLDESEKLWFLLSVWQYHVLVYIDKFKGKYCLFADLKDLFYGIREEVREPFAQKAISLIEEWVSTRATTILTSEAFLQILPHQSNSEEQLNIAEEAEGEGEECDDEKESDAIEAKNPSGQVDKKKKKKSVKKKKPKHGKGVQAAAIIKEEKKLDVDFEHVNRVGKKDNAAVEIICAYGQLDTIRTYCSFLRHQRREGSTSSAFLQSTSTLRRRGLYQVLCHRFQDGVNGEQRTVQPADDLALLVSAAYYEDLHAYMERQEYNRDSLLLATKWLHYLQFALKASPFNAKLKLEMLEVCRYLGNTTIAAQTFQNLGVKHIQYDSLSYVILPNYFEGGFFSEAMKIYRNILAFHRLCQKECVEVLSKGFEFANYNKIIEVFDFAKDCKKSVQLFLAKAELPLLEIAAESSPTFEKVRNYIFTLVDEKKYPEYLSYLEEDELSSAISNLDTKIIERFQCSPWAADHKEENEKRVEEIVSRIKISQDLIYGLYHLVNKDVTALRKCYHRLSLTTNTDSRDSVHNFSQSIYGPSKVRYLCWRLIIQWFEVALVLLGEDSSGKEKLSFEAILTTEQSLFSYLLSEEEQFIPIENQEGLKNYISPMFTKAVSFYVYTVRAWIPVLLEAILPHATTFEEDVVQARSRWQTFRGKNFLIFCDCD